MPLEGGKIGEEAQWETSACDQLGNDEDVDRRAAQHQDHLMHHCSPGFVHLTTLGSGTAIPGSSGSCTVSAFPASDGVRVADEGASSAFSPYPLWPVITRQYLCGQ